MKEAIESTAISASSSAEFMASFLSSHQPPAESLKHFQSTWLSRYLNSPEYRPIPTWSRQLKGSGEDYFFSRTINSSTTIPHLITLKRRDMKTPDSVQDMRQLEDDPSIPHHKRVTAVPTTPDALILLQLANPGIDGHPNTLHGGITCALLDETMGLLVMLHDNQLNHTDHRNSLYTANLNVSFRGPIPTPSNILIKTWLVGRSGRKWLSKGQICDELGRVLAEADGLWVSVKPKL